MQDSFLVLPCHSICPVSLLLLFYFALRFAPLAVHSTFSLSQLAVSVASLRCRYPVSLFPPFTRRLCSPDSLFLLLAFVFASQSHASCAFFLVLTSCLASFPSPRPAFHHLQYGSLTVLQATGSWARPWKRGYKLAVCTHGAGAGVGTKAETREGWSKHSRVTRSRMLPYLWSVLYTFSYIHCSFVPRLFIERKNKKTMAWQLSRVQTVEFRCPGVIV